MNRPLLSFIETTWFTKRVTELLSDQQYIELQWRLIEFPEAGNVIIGSGGIRKIRASAKGKGTRGGARVIYYFAAAKGQIYMLDIYAKNEQADLSTTQIAQLKEIVRTWL
jgi:hypothetical protein